MMPSWDLAVGLDARADTPIFLQIARAISDDVRRGRLRPGDALPGSRTLATSLGVHRNTVLAAYRELAAEGWIATDGRETIVSASLPDPTPRRFALSATPRVEVPSRVGFELRPIVDRWEPLPVFSKGTLVLASGLPDLRLLPVAPLARAYRRVLRARGGRAVLDYGDPRGHVRLRRALATMLCSLRGLAATPETLLVTRGSQMAIDLVARTLIAPGDVVAVEGLGYRPAWAALRAAGARLVPIPVDDHGLRIDALTTALQNEPFRAIYTTPHHQYPTTKVLPPGRRLQLLELARTNKLAVIEDDYDYEFHYEGRPVLPLASADRAGVVVYIGTLSKVLAPGLRLGFVVAPEPLLERIASVRAFVDRQGDQATECAVAEMIEDGEVQRHVRRMRNAYRARRDALVEALRSSLGAAVDFDVPAGGMALWLRANDVDMEAWAAASAKHGAAFYTAKRFAFDGRPRPFARIGFAALSEPELREAVSRMTKGHATVRRRAKAS
jgi:GntR family transcriptional regulator / MocR family aminotransferase